ncbi:unnamed protein product, partial [Iphiclides podalirius]
MSARITYLGRKVAENDGDDAASRVENIMAIYKIVEIGRTLVGCLRIEPARCEVTAASVCVPCDVVTRSARGIRGALHATLIAFDKQWNLALADVLEVWTKKAPRKRKIPPALGTPVPKGTAATISHVPTVTETPLGKGVWECTRHISQLMVRGEHVVLLNIVER